VAAAEEILARVEARFERVETVPVDAVSLSTLPRTG
jgi:hypothetical protein